MMAPATLEAIKASREPGWKINAGIRGFVTFDNPLIANSADSQLLSHGILSPLQSFAQRQYFIRKTKRAISHSMLESCRLAVVKSKRHALSTMRQPQTRTTIPVTRIITTIPCAPRGIQHPHGPTHKLLVIHLSFLGQQTNRSAKPNTIWRQIESKSIRPRCLESGLQW